MELWLDRHHFSETHGEFIDIVSMHPNWAYRALQKALDNRPVDYNAGWNRYVFNLKSRATDLIDGKPGLWYSE